jgi:hypothetical protein
VNLPQPAFLAGRWQGRVPLAVLFWRDMLVVGSSINLAAGFVVLMLIAQGVSLGLAVALHFLLLPYNLFLALAVWRSPQRTRLTTSTAGLWLVLFTVA